VNPAVTDKGNVSWKAQWIWARGKAKKEFHFCYFRKSFDMGKDAPHARIYCTADSKYRLWVNGEYVGTGPARGPAEHPYYDTHTVPLKAGPNTLAVLVEHYLGHCGIFAPVQGGLACQVEAGGSVVAATDRSWRALSSEAYTPLPGFLWPEAFDARLEPEGWEQPGFDDGGWPRAKVLRESKLAAPESFLPRPIPPLTETRLDPVLLLDVGVCEDKECKDLRACTEISQSLFRCELKPPLKGLTSPHLEPQMPWRGKPIRINLNSGQPVYLVLDFGKQTLAHPEIKVRGPAGIIVDMGRSECLQSNRVATLWPGGRPENIGQSERIVLREGLTHHRINQPRGFRYMMLRFANPTRQAVEPVVLEDVCAHEAIYPTVERGQFRCSDPLLEDIFKLSARTVNLCMEDGYTDCPWRERAQWLGDFQPEALISYYAFGSYDIARKAVLEFAAGTAVDGWIAGVYPSNRPSNLPTWGMRFPVAAWEYYMHTGDREVLPTAYDSSRRMLEWLQPYESEDCLMVGLVGWCFLDWNWLDVGASDGALQGWYLDALDHTALLARECGEKKAAADYERRAKRLRKTLAEKYWSPERKAFLKYRPGNSARSPKAAPDLIGQHENFQFPLLGVGTPAQRRQALQSIAGAAGLYLPDIGCFQSGIKPDFLGNYSSESVILIGSPFWSFYALQSLMEAGKVREALDYMRVGWGTMLQFGATSCWETWGRNASLCHGWSGAPGYILPAYVLGVRPTKPGFKQFEVQPRVGNLKWASGKVPTPLGTIDVSWKLDERTGGFRCEVEVPKGAKGRFVPDRTRFAPGKAVALGPGKHVIELGPRK